MRQKRKKKMGRLPLSSIFLLSIDRWVSIIMIYTQFKRKRLDSKRYSERNMASCILIRDANLVRSAPRQHYHNETKREAARAPLKRLLHVKISISQVYTLFLARPEQLCNIFNDLGIHSGDIMAQQLIHRLPGHSKVIIQPGHSLDQLLHHEISHCS